MVAIDGPYLMLDAPLADRIDDAYGGATVEKLSDTRIVHVGVEQLHFSADFDRSLAVENYVGENDVNIGTYYYDEEHAWTAVQVDNLKHGWVSNVRFVYWPLSW